MDQRSYVLPNTQRHSPQHTTSSCQHANRHSSTQQFASIWSPSCVHTRITRTHPTINTQTPSTSPTCSRHATTHSQRASNTHTRSLLSPPHLVPSHTTLQCDNRLSLQKSQTDALRQQHPTTHWSVPTSCSACTPKIMLTHAIPAGRTPTP